MKLSIIIVNWNVCDLLQQCIASVYENMRMARAEFEVIVIDNASTDGSLEMLKCLYPQVVAIANTENVGFAKANNQAFIKCKGEYVLLLNPDTIILENAIDVLLTHAVEHEDVAVMGCRLLNTDYSLQRWTGGSYPNLWNIACHYLYLDRLLPETLRPSTLYLDRDYGQDVDVDWVCGAVMLLKKACFKNTIFNESFFMYGEDMECCYRLKKEGWRVVYSPVCSIVHVQGASMKKQEGEVLLSSLKGLRSFYIMLHGHKWVWLLDYLTLKGFFLRWFCFSFLRLFRPGQGYREKACSSWKYIQLTKKIMMQSPP